MSRSPFQTDFVGTTVLLPSQLCSAPYHFSCLNLENWTSIFQAFENSSGRLETKREKEFSLSFRILLGMDCCFLSNNGPSLACLRTWESVTTCYPSLKDLEISINGTSAASLCLANRCFSTLYLEEILYITNPVSYRELFSIISSCNVTYQNSGFHWKNPKIQPFISKGPRKRCNTNGVRQDLFGFFFLKYEVSDASVTGFLRKQR